MVALERGTRLEGKACIGGVGVDWGGYKAVVAPVQQQFWMGWDGESGSVLILGECTGTTMNEWTTIGKEVFVKMHSIHSAPCQQPHEARVAFAKHLAPERLAQPVLVREVTAA
jgi:hypothetical protein